MESLHKHWPTSQGQSPTGLFPASFRKADNDAEFATDQELYLILRGSFVMTRLSCRGEPVYWYYGKANDLLTTGAMGGWAEIPDTNHDLEISQPMETIEMSVESQGKIAPRPLLLGRQHEANLQRELLPGSGDDGQEPLQSGTLEAVASMKQISNANCYPGLAMTDKNHSRAVRWKRSLRSVASRTCSPLRQLRRRGCAPASSQTY